MKRARLILTALLLLSIITLTTACRDDNSGNVEEAVEKVPDSAEKICPILLGEALPQLTLRTVDGNSFNVNQAIAEKPTVLVFYRGGWCMYCNKQLQELQDIEGDIIKAGYRIIAISPDKPEKLAESIDKDKLNYLLLSDSDMTAAKALGIAFELDEATLKKYEEYGIDLYAATGQKHYMLPVPAVFVVGTDGIVTFQYVNPNYKVRLNSDILLAAVKANN